MKKGKSDNHCHELHTWSFCRSGGFDQVILETGEDLKALSQLDQKLWAVLSCPSEGLEFDSQTLSMIDSDGDGRIRVPDVLAALKWTLALLKDPSSLLDSNDKLPLAAIDDSTEEGAMVLASAKQILKNLGKEGSGFVTAEDSDDEREIFADTPFNGDGVITPKAASSDDTSSVISTIMATTGSVTDVNGEDGVTQDIVNEFFGEAALYNDWWCRALKEGDVLLPLGDNTCKGEKAFAAVEKKIEDFFARVRLAQFDERAAAELNPPEGIYQALGKEQISLNSPSLEDLPLAQLGKGEDLSLIAGINPAWYKEICDFRNLVVLPVLGKEHSISEKEFLSIRELFKPYRAWKKDVEDFKVSSLSVERVKEIIEGPYKKQLDALIEKDKALAPEARGITAVNRLAHFHRDLFIFLNNFVSLKDFYSSEEKAIFQAGTLYIDGRSSELCIKVDDIGKHSAIAPLSRTYLLYCHCSSKDSKKSFDVAVAMTSGDGNNLKAGRNGVFYDRKGQDWDATIVKIVENPVSVWQAFWSPYRRIATLVSDQVEKMVAAKAREVEQSAVSEITTVATVTSAASVQDGGTRPFDVARFAGIFAAIGLALGAIGTAAASLFTGFLALPWWQMPLVLVGIPMILSGPSMIVAYIKLRQRNLGPLLDANGWAVNTRATINIAFGSSLTQVAKLPDGSRFVYADPHSGKLYPWKMYLVLGAIDLVALWLLLTGRLSDIVTYMAKWFLSSFGY